MNTITISRGGVHIGEFECDDARVIELMAEELSKYKTKSVSEQVEDEEVINTPQHMPKKKKKKVIKKDSDDEEEFDGPRNSGKTEEVREMLLEGKSAKEIEEATGVKIGTIYVTKSNMKKAGLLEGVTKSNHNSHAPAPRLQPLTVSQYNDIQESKRHGLAEAEIARQMLVSTHQVKQVVQAFSYDHYVKNF